MGLLDLLGRKRARDKPRNRMKVRTSHICSDERPVGRMWMSLKLCRRQLCMLVSVS